MENQKSYVTPEPARNWKTIDDFEGKDFFFFTKAGEAFEGRLDGFREIKTANGMSRVADFEDELGQFWTIFVSAGMRGLDEKQIGNYLRIEYLGMEKNLKSKRDFKKFAIFVDTNHSKEAIADGDVPF